MFILSLAASEFGPLIFSDNFTQNGQIDTQKWSKRVVPNPPNAEKQYYTDSDLNAFVSDNSLHIKAIKQTLGTKEYTSAKLTTQNTKLFKYGKFDITAKLPIGLGTWPAFWLFSPEVNNNPYAEIDIMESVGADPNEIWFSVHSNSGSEDKKEHHTAGTNASDISNVFHTYSIQWTPQYIKGLVDEKVYFQLNKKDIEKQYWHFDQEMFLILNLAVGGSWGGYAGICTDCFPQEIVIKSVNVYEYVGVKGLKMGGKIAIGVVVGVLVVTGVIVAAVMYVKHTKSKKKSIPKQKMTKTNHLI
ncbi:family_16 glycosylhydrolase [Hexamita inflata]|uniref:Family 16 glycosylhydrolase n=1 Tax=Hexamita inflata TaxID=28002 RepID=A0AA86QSF1_9EUKA|nr:family 16 glycosylhydrolase [Hexamita inflata]